MDSLGFIFILSLSVLFHPSLFLITMVVTLSVDTISRFYEQGFVQSDIPQT